MKNKIIFLFSIVFMSTEISSLQAQDALVNNQMNVSSNNRFITIGVNGYYSSDTGIYSGADAYFDVNQLKDLGPSGVGYTNISSFMFSDPGSSDGTDYVRQLGDYNCDSDDFIRKQDHGTTVIDAKASANRFANGQDFISMAKLEWLYRNTSIFMNDLSPPYLPGQNQGQNDKSIRDYIRFLIANGVQYKDFLATGPANLAYELAPQIATGRLTYDQVAQTYGDQGS